MMMETRRPIPEVLETSYTESSLQRIDDSENPIAELTDDHGYSKIVMKAFRRARKAGKKNDIRSRKIVESLRLKREGKVVDTMPSALGGQTTIGDF